MNTTAPAPTVLIDRWHLLQERLAQAGADGLLLGGGSDLAHLTGYHAMPFERLTALVARADHDRPTLLVPELELGRVERCEEAFDVASWSELEDPVATALGVLGDTASLVISDDLWAMHVLALARQRPELELRTVSEALMGIRVVKTEDELEALQVVGGLADQVMAMVQSGAIPLVGRTEQAIATDIADNLLKVGHDTVEFVIVASGPNSASPHHHPGERVVEPDEMVLFDFGGSHKGYNSDTTRCVFTGPVPIEVQRAWNTLRAAQQAAVDAAAVGNRLCDVDDAARSVLADAGYGPAFIHRTGHGIGTEVHEQPYVTAENTAEVAVGYAFSIEPGVYYDGRWGMRLEDIVVIGPDGRAVRCNHSERDLVSVG
ncbi:MAG: M24 family metallopeptidase [Actinomycetota bacterium]